MVKKLSLGAITLAFALMMPSGASAQLTYGVSTGMSIPQGDFGNSQTTGYNVGAEAFYTLPHLKGIGVGGNVAFNMFKGKELSDGGFIVKYENITACAILPSIRYLFPLEKNSSFGLYAQVGVGLNALDGVADAAGIIKTETDLAWALGVGVTYKLNDKITLLASPNYNSISAAASWNYFSVNAGIVFGK
jgi:opacity protein-like surface antigen